MFVCCFRTIAQLHGIITTYVKRLFRARRVRTRNRCDQQPSIPHSTCAMCPTVWITIHTTACTIVPPFPFERAALPDCTCHSFARCYFVDFLYECGTGPNRVQRFARAA